MVSLGQELQLNKETIIGMGLQRLPQNVDACRLQHLHSTACREAPPRASMACAYVKGNVGQLSLARVKLSPIPFAPPVTTATRSLKRWSAMATWS